MAAIRERWSVAARAYCREHDFARGHEAAAEVIERIGHQKLERSQRHSDVLDQADGALGPDREDVGFYGQVAFAS